MVMSLVGGTLSCFCLGLEAEAECGLGFSFTYVVRKFTCPPGSTEIAPLKFKLLSHLPQSGRCWSAGPCVACSMGRGQGVFWKSKKEQGPSPLLPVDPRAYFLFCNYTSWTLALWNSLLVAKGNRPVRSKDGVLMALWAAIQD